MKVKIIDQIKGKLSGRPKKGQSMVETALVLPVLLIMFLGVFEVGWALRSYLVLVNVNREATRFAARGIYLDLAEKNDPFKVGYDKVITHTVDSLASQLSMDLYSVNPNAAMVLTYYSLEPTVFECPGDPDCSAFDCSRFAYENRNEGDFVAGEDLNEIEYPLLIDSINDPQNPAPSYYIPPNNILGITNTTAITSYHFHQGTPDFSRINPADKLVELRSQNNEHNCQLAKKNLPATNNTVIIVENIFQQNQLVGFPVINFFIPDPYPLYSHTQMRLSTNIRETAADDSSEVCELTPVMIPASLVGNLFQGQQIAIPVNAVHDTPSNFAYLDWDLTPTDPELALALADATTTSSFAEPQDATDTTLNLGDWIQANPGTKSGVAAVEGAINGLINESLVMPVWNDSDCIVSGAGTCANAQRGGGDSDRFKVFTFIVMKLIDHNYTGGTATTCPAGTTCLVLQHSNFSPNTCTCDPLTDTNCDLP